MAIQPRSVRTSIEGVRNLGRPRPKVFRRNGNYTGEKMFAIFEDDSFSFKLSPEDREKALELDGAKVFTPAEEGHSAMPEYIVMPMTVLDDDDKFQGWLTKSAEYVRSKMKAAS